MLGGGGNVPVQNIECYKAVALKNTFSAITEPHDNTIIDEKWPTLVESLAPPSQAVRRAQKAAFWMMSVKDRERDRRRRSREDDELMQSFIDEQIDALADQYGLGRSAATHSLLTSGQPSAELVEPGAVGALVTYLCSKAAKDVTGVALPIDGGWTAR